MKIHPLFAFSILATSALADTYKADVVIYGGTSAAITAAVQAKRMGKTAIIVSPDRHLGGLSSGGLGFTDTGNKSVIGGLSREFYHRIWQHYSTPEAWKWQKQSEYGNKGQGTPAIDGEQRTMWIFEPSASEKVCEAFIAENQIPVYRDEWLDREKGVEKRGQRIVSITTLKGNRFEGRIFIDTTYEGDLMASASVDYHVGRESQAEFEEKWAGIQTGVLHHGHHFGVLKNPMSPYLVPGDPKSGVLPHISTVPPGEFGAADHRVQAYCFRMCLTNHPENRIPFEKPEGYDPREYELLIRVLDAGWKQVFGKFDPIPNHKTDTNNHGPFSTDFIGGNYEYPEASYEKRKEIIRAHERYQKGWLYFISTDPRVPQEIREKMQTWGLPKDEFTDNGGWSHQLYIREARRMMGKMVMTENELLKRRPTPESVGMGSYTIDSHNVQRYITPEGAVQNEGDIGVGLPGPYEIAYGSLVPKPGQADNLLVPVCVSSTHVAFGSIRMEPVFMILGQSAATAGVLAIDSDMAVQDVPYTKLREILLKDGQILEYTGPLKTVSDHQPARKLDGILLDESDTEKTGDWAVGSLRGISVIGGEYMHDSNEGKGAKTLTWNFTATEDGSHEVIFHWPKNNNRAKQAPITITAGSSEPVSHSLNLREKGEQSLGTFALKKGEKVRIKLSNEATEGYVVADGVQILRK